MKRKGLPFVMGTALAAIVIGSAAGCGGSSTPGALAAGAGAAATAQSPSPQPQVHIQSLDTVQLLEQARRVSDTADPYGVDDGALRLTDTSDASDPILVNAI